MILSSILLVCAAVTAQYFWDLTVKNAYKIINYSLTNYLMQVKIAKKKIQDT